MYASLTNRLVIIPPFTKTLTQTLHLSSLLVTMSTTVELHGLLAQLVGLMNRSDILSLSCPKNANVRL